jgi:hypothetical protein
MWLKSFGVLPAVIVSICCANQLRAFQPPPGVDFQKEVRPILANHCFACHGFDDKSRQADLRLDLPGDSKASQLLQRIQSHDPDLIMPPASTNKPLSNQQKEILQRWIAQGAQYEKHWALAPPSRTELPDPRAMELNNDHWVQNPIDVWVGFELQNHQIQPSPPADAATLARRLYLDLLGTIPCPDELIEFQSDSSPNKIDRLIEKLLASPQFGERWGRFWLDQARYADSNGFTIDGVRNMWPYRDWVIAAINADMPFDQFTIEQLAGDLLHEPSKNQLIASAFHRNTMINEEGSSIGSIPPVLCGWA